MYRFFRRQNLLINVNVTSCGDKGLSFGEKTKTSVTNVIAKKIHSILLSKMTSEVRIKNYSSDKNESQICVSVENKKQEFGSGNLFISNINNKCKFLRDETSNIIKMQRTETKFLLSKSEIDYFFKQKNLYETYPKRKIFSVYFDTDNFKDFYDSEEGTVP